jgi:hypothetical protein
MEGPERQPFDNRSAIERNHARARLFARFEARTRIAFATLTR